MRLGSIVVTTRLDCGHIVICILPFCNFVRFFTICMMKLLSIISHMRIQGIPGRLSLRGLENRGYVAASSALGKKP